LGADKLITIDAGSTCTVAGVCNSILQTACPNPDLIILTGTGNIVKKIPYCDDAGVAVSTLDLQNACIFHCNSIVNQIKGSVGDEKYSINQNTFTKSLCNALRIVSGSAGKTFAAFAIIATGIGFFTGKVSWGLMIGVTAGIATMFGAPSIVAAISGQDTKTSCNLN
jgi:type IV secretory pathway VirB2 component (pilin)